MILRRLAQNLKQQNWTAIWIEFILLVSGVFLGIQVANWNESRKESIQELADLKNLAQDIRSDILEIDETIAISTWRMFVHVPKIPTYTDIDNKSVGLVYVNIRTIDGNRSTYDTIINTGGIRLIKDAKLLEQIQNYYVAVDEIKDTEIYLQANCESAREALHEAGISPVDRKNLAELSEVIARNPKALASSKTVWGSTGNQIKILNDLRQQANALLADIEERKKP